MAMATFFCNLSILLVLRIRRAWEIGEVLINYQYLIINQYFSPSFSFTICFHKIKSLLDRLLHALPVRVVTPPSGFLTEYLQAPLYQAVD